MFSFLGADMQPNSESAKKTLLVFGSQQEAIVKLLIPSASSET